MVKEEVMLGAAEQQRRAEIEAGRRRFEENAGRADLKRGEVAELRKLGDRQLEEDEERRKAVWEAPPLSSTIERDRAGAEVADQAQTELEALGHLADRADRIVTSEHSNAVERMEHPDADPERAKAVTMDTVTAQAVNQPTVLANERGIPTEVRPLNISDFRDEELELDRPGITPDDRLVPKTREQAEQVAREKTPEPEDVVQPGWHEGKGEDPDAPVRAVEQWPKRLRPLGVAPDTGTGEKKRRGRPPKAR